MLMFVWLPMTFESNVQDIYCWRMMTVRTAGAYTAITVPRFHGFQACVAWMSALLLKLLTISVVNTDRLFNVVRGAVREGFKGRRIPGKN